MSSHSNHFSLGGVLLVGGQSGNTLLGSIYRLKSTSEKWELLKQKLETPRRYHIALNLPSSVVTSCWSTGTLLAEMLGWDASDFVYFIYLFYCNYSHYYSRKFIDTSSIVTSCSSIDNCQHWKKHFCYFWLRCCLMGWIGFIFFEN